MFVENEVKTVAKIHNAVTDSLIFLDAEPYNRITLVG